MYATKRCGHAADAVDKELLSKPRPMAELGGHRNSRQSATNPRTGRIRQDNCASSEGFIPTCATTGVEHCRHLPVACAVSISARTHQAFRIRAAWPPSRLEETPAAACVGKLPPARIVRHDRAAAGQSHSGFAYARDNFGMDHAFEGICAELLARHQEEPIRPSFHAVLIDEAQELAQPFFEAVYHVTLDPKRIRWAYDELQNLGAYRMAPAAKLFGNRADGSPNGPSVDGDWAAGTLRHRAADLLPQYAMGAFDRPCYWTGRLSVLGAVWFTISINPNSGRTSARR